MVNTALNAAVVAALRRMRGVRVVTLFGSQARGAGDAESDLDLQLITARPRDFNSPAWTAALPERLLAYARRPAFGGVVKVTAVFPAGEVDLVVLPLGRLRLARLLVACGLHRRSRRLRRALGDLTIVLRPGYQMLLGSGAWRRFFQRLLAEVPDPALDDREVGRLADCAYADYVSLQRKLARGELVAARRWLHVHLVETNLKLMHEARRRGGGVSFHDGRRAEQVWSEEELAAVRADAGPGPAEIGSAAARAIGTTDQLTRQLTGRPPRWAGALAVPERPGEPRAASDSAFTATSRRMG